MWQVRLPPTKGPNDGPLIHQLRQLQGRAVQAPPAISKEEFLPTQAHLVHVSCQL